MVSREILLIGGAIVGSEATGITNLTGIGGSESDSESPEVPAIGGSVPDIDFSGIGEAIGKAGSVGGGFSPTLDLSDLVTGSGFNPDPSFDFPKTPFSGGNNDKNKKNSGSGNLENLDERWWKNWEENSQDVSEGVGGGLEEITLGTADEFFQSAKERINPPNNSDPTGTPESPEGQEKLVEGVFDPNTSTSEAFEQARQEVNKNKKKSSGSSDSGGGSSSSGGSSPEINTGFSKPEPILEDSEVKGKTEAEAQAEKVGKAFSIDKNSSESSGSKNKKKEDKKGDSGFSNPFLR